MKKIAIGLLILIGLCACAIIGKNLGIGRSGDFFGLDSYKALHEETVTIEKTIDFYFKTGPNSFKAMSSSDEDTQKIKALITQDIGWITPKGISVNEYKIDLVTKIVTWKDGDSTISIDGGFGLIIRATVHVGPEAEFGENEIKLSIPNLIKLAEVTKTTYSGLTCQDSKKGIAKIHV